MRNGIEINLQFFLFLGPSNTLDRARRRVSMSNMPVSSGNVADISKTPVPRSQSNTCSAPAILHHPNNSTPVTLTLTNATASEIGASHNNNPSTASRPENSPYPKPFLPEQQNLQKQNNQTSSQTYGFRASTSHKNSIGGGMRMSQPHNTRGVLMKHHTTIAPRLQPRSHHAQSFNAFMTQQSQLMTDRSKTMYHDSTKMQHPMTIPHNGQVSCNNGTMITSVGNSGYPRGNLHPDAFPGIDDAYDSLDILSHSMEEEKIQQLRNVSNTLVYMPKKHRIFLITIFVLKIGYY